MRSVSSSQPPDGRSAFEEARNHDTPTLKGALPTLVVAISDKSVRSTRCAARKIKGSNQNVRPTVFLLKAQSSSLEAVLSTCRPYRQIPTSSAILFLRRCAHFLGHSQRLVLTLSGHLPRRSIFCVLDIGVAGVDGSIGLAIAVYVTRRDPRLLSLGTGSTRTFAIRRAILIHIGRRNVGVTASLSLGLPIIAGHDLAGTLLLSRQG